jgi:DNA-binding winged helix-turn-helix (wHTH) protein
LQRTNHLYEFGPFSVDVEERVLLRDGRVVPLPPKAFSILFALVREQGRVVSKADLMREVWPEDSVEEGNLTQNIFTLRRVLQGRDEAHSYIETIPRRGYRFAGVVVEKTREPGAPRSATASEQSENAEAREAYLKGRYFWSKCTRRALEKSIEWFRTAIDRDPNFAIAYVGMADSYTRLATTHAAPAEMMPKAEAAVRQALRVDEGLAEAHASLGMLKMRRHWDWEGGRCELIRAIELKPDYATAHLWLGNYFDMRGDFENALAAKKRALKLDPLSLQINVSIASTLWLMRKNDEAMFRLRETLDMDQNFLSALVMLGFVNELSYDYRSAIANLERARSIDDAPVVQAYLGRAYAVAGERSKARAIISRLQKQPSRRFAAPYAMALIECGLGARDRALDCLESAYEAKDEWLVWLNVDPRLDHLRRTDRFRNLAGKLGFIPQTCN